MIQLCVSPLVAPVDASGDDNRGLVIPFSFTATIRTRIQVGYSIRFENCTSEKTIIKYMTGAHTHASACKHHPNHATSIMSRRLSLLWTTR